MAEVARLVGMELRSYMGDDGKPRQFCGLHLMHVEGTQRKVNGCKVESLPCPRDINPSGLALNRLYQLEYEMFETKNGKGARLVELLPVDELEPEQQQPVTDSKQQVK